MTLQYGNFSFDSDTVAPVITASTSLNEAMESYITTRRWSLTGMIHGDDQNTVVANLALMEAAFSVNGKDLRLIGNDGSTVCHALLNAGSVSGVRITQPPSYPQGEGAELSTFRTFTITAEADYYFAPQKLEQLKAFQETITFSGGGPEFDVIELINGPPVFYRVRNFTAYRATQTGSAVGLHRSPTMRPPLWPGNQVRGQTVSKMSPKWMGKEFIDFGISWSYEFVSANPLVGEPNRWTGV